MTLVALSLSTGRPQRVRGCRGVWVGARRHLHRAAGCSAWTTLSGGGHPAPPPVLDGHTRGRRAAGGFSPDRSAV